MPIHAGEIRILKSEAFNDTDQGGGKATDQEVVNGLSNNIFNDISELARAYGQVSLRKVFPSIFTDTTDTLFGTHVVIAKLPTDDKIKVALFTTKDWEDTRKDARELLERYLARGPKWAGHILETQLVGQRAIQLVLRTNDPIPVVGQGLALVQDENLLSEKEQYVRVTKIETAEREFPVGGGKSVTRKVATLELSDPLRYTFEGPSVAEFEEGVKPKAVCRDTRVADAARYYGASKLAAPVSLGDGKVQVESIFTNLVPSTQSETAMTNLTAAGENGTLVGGSATPTTITLQTTVSTTVNTYLGSAIYPKSLSFTINGLACYDNGGDIKTANGVIGTVEYDKGLLRWNENAPSGIRDIAYTFIPAAVPIKVADTDSFPIRQENRGYVYTRRLFPVPAPASTVLTYVAQKKVYYLRDNGDGKLIGSDPAFGTGTIDYVTGNVVVTLGAQPDAGSDVMFSFGTKGAYYSRADIPVAPMTIAIDCGVTGIASGTVNIKWKVNGVQKTATDTTGGVLQGDATGYVNYGTGIIHLIPTILPHKGTEFDVVVGAGPSISGGVANNGANPEDDGYATFTLGDGNLLPNSVGLQIPLNYVVDEGMSGLPVVRTTTMYYHDVPVNATTGNLVTNFTNQVHGTINYQTGVVRIKPVLTYKKTKYEFAQSEGYYGSTAPYGQA